MEKGKRESTFDLHSSSSAAFDSLFLMNFDCSLPSLLNSVGYALCGERLPRHTHSGGVPISLCQMEVIGAAGVIQPLLMENNRDGDYGLVAYKMVPGKFTPAEVKEWLLNDLVAIK